MNTQFNLWKEKEPLILSYTYIYDKAEGRKLGENIC